LDGSASTDADSSPGTNDDIVDFAWSEVGVEIGHGRTLAASFLPGAHTVVLTVTDSRGLIDTDEAVVTVADVDRDGDGVTACGGDCDDADASTHPGAFELCDGRDNDCNGEIDEGRC